jgi:hypothetical protein
MIGNYMAFNFVSSSFLCGASCFQTAPWFLFQLVFALFKEEWLYVDRQMYETSLHIFGRQPLSDLLLFRTRTAHCFQRVSPPNRTASSLEHVMLRTGGSLLDTFLSAAHRTAATRGFVVLLRLFTQQLHGLSILLLAKYCCQMTIMLTFVSRYHCKAVSTWLSCAIRASVPTIFIFWNEFSHILGWHVEQHSGCSLWSNWSWSLRPDHALRLLIFPSAIHDILLQAGLASYRLRISDRFAILWMTLSLVVLLISLSCWRSSSPPI